MKVSDIIKRTGGRLISGDADIEIPPHRFSTDSRSLKKGDLFIAIKGPKFDGNDFVTRALKQGAIGAIISRRASCVMRHAHNAKRKAHDKSRVIILVKDTTLAYGAIAHHYRLLFNIPILAVTGSNGKTTTKEMLSHILSGRFRVLKNDGTRNNQIGVPETLLRLKKTTDIAVLEFGMNHLGEIRYLSGIAKPSLGIITNIGPSHLESLRSLGNVFRGKRELLEALPKGAGAIINGDDVFLSRFRAVCLKVTTFGLNKHNSISASGIRFRNGVWDFIVNDKHPFRLRMLGRHNIYNALAAIAAARSFGLGFSYMAKRLLSFREASGKRLAVKDIGGVKFIDDSYNSNPLSLRCALDALLEYETDGRRFLVSGDMLELGALARSFHEEAGELIARSKIDYLVTMGDLSGATRSGALRLGMDKSMAKQCSNHAQAASFLKRLARARDVILVKGSRTMGMEKVIEEFKAMR